MLKSSDVDQTFPLKVVWGPDDSSSLVRLRLLRLRKTKNFGIMMRNDFATSPPARPGTPSDNELENLDYKKAILFNRMTRMNSYRSRFYIVLI